MEAQPGFEIAAVQGLLQNSLKYQPNVVLINAGHNDCVNKDDTGVSIFLFTGPRPCACERRPWMASLLAKDGKE